MVISLHEMKIRIEGKCTFNNDDSRLLLEITYRAIDSNIRHGVGKHEHIGGCTITQKKKLI